MFSAQWFMYQNQSERYLTVFCINRTTNVCYDFIRITSVVAKSQLRNKIRNKLKNKLRSELKIKVSTEFVKKVKNGLSLEIKPCKVSYDMRGHQIRYTYVPLCIH